MQERNTVGASQEDICRGSDFEESMTDVHHGIELNDASRFLIF